METITISNELVKEYQESFYDIYHYREGNYIKLHKTDEMVKIEYYPILNALRNMDYNANYTEQELRIIQGKISKFERRIRLQQEIERLQTELNNLIE